MDAAAALNAPTVGRGPTGQCARCGLPAMRGSAFCCYGCELADRLQSEAGDGASSARASALLAGFLTMNLMMFSLYLYGDDVYGESWPALRSLFRVGSFAVATPVYAILGVPLARSAIAALRRGALTSELLVGVGAAAAYLVSLWSLVTGRGAVFFETGCMVLLLTTVGRYLEALARASAGASLQARLRLGGDTVERLLGDARVVVSIAELVVGDRIHVPVGRAVPVDGRVDVDGAHLSVAMLTGEADLRALRRGERVAAGSVVERAPLDVLVTATARDSTLEKLARLAEEARVRRSRVEGLADRLASLLIPLVAAVAIASFAVTARRLGFEAALVRSLTIVLVACPCSFGLAVPLAMVRALDEAALRGVVVRGADVLERLAAVRRIVFDKTGTLTERGLRIERVESPSLTDVELLGLCASIEREVDHPIAHTLVAVAHARGAILSRAEHVVVFEGGIRGEVAGRSISIGRGHDPDVVEVSADGATIGRIFLGERVRPAAAPAIAALRTLGLSVELATGDASTRARVTAAALGLDATLGMSPRAKLARIEAIAALGPVAMVGDGHNDAPALAGASVGVALGSGADITQGIAGVCIVDSDLAKLPWLVVLARRARTIAVQNLAWALVYNAGFLTLAVLGELNPVIAAVAMLGSSIAVVVNSMRIGGSPRSAPGPAPAPTTSSTLAPELGT